MEKTLKEKTTTALIWSFIDKFGQQIIYFVSGIILARKLTPEDYGLVGVLTVFITISTILIGSGYGRALINKPKINQEELDTVFIYYIGIGITIYLILFFCAPLIGQFFKQPLLVPLSRVLFISIIFISFSSIQDVIFSKKLDLKNWAKANFLSLLPASILSIIAVFCGLGVWSLVIQTLMMSFFKLFTYWHYGGFRPSWSFKTQVLKELFPFSSKILLTNFINAIFNNIYPVLIGRIYNTTQLGFYTQASKYQDIPTSLINNTFRSVSSPLLSGVNDDDKRLKRILSKLIKTIAFICFPTMLGLILIAKPMFIVLITEKWLQSVPIFQILCVSGIFLALNYAIQESILAKGHSGELLAVEILKKVILVLLILVTVNHGVIGLAMGLAVSSFCTLILSLLLSGRIVGYSVIDLVKDCFPYCFISLTLCIIAYYLSLPIANNVIFILVCISFLALFYMILCKVFKLEAFEEMFMWLKIKRRGKAN